MLRRLWITSSGPDCYIGRPYLHNEEKKFYLTEITGVVSKHQLRVWYLGGLKTACLIVKNGESCCQSLNPISCQYDWPCPYLLVYHWAGLSTKLMGERGGEGEREIKKQSMLALTVVARISVRQVNRLAIEVDTDIGVLSSKSTAGSL